MIKDSDGDVFEEMRTVEQGLTFQEAEEAFARYHVDFTEDKYIALGLRNIHDDQYTNLALILSDQCKHTTKIAVFGDDANTVFKDAKEFDGSVLKQLEESYAYLSLCNRTTAIFKGLERIEKSDYPEEALREALLNALFIGITVTVEALLSMSIIPVWNLFRLEAVAGVVSGRYPEWNFPTAQPETGGNFHRLKLIESYGTGIRKNICTL